MGKKLTLLIARKFLQDNGAVDLGEFISIADDAAAALSKHKGPLVLDGLTELSAEIAAVLSTHEGPLSLDGLTELPAGTAQALAEHKDGIWLNGLTELSANTATALSALEGPLVLDGLTELSDAAAQALSEHKGSLSLDGLTELPAEIATALSKHEGALFLNGLTELDDDLAEAFAEHKGDLSFKGLENISDEVATAFARHQDAGWGELDLNPMDKAVVIGMRQFEPGLFELELLNVQIVFFTKIFGDLGQALGSETLQGLRQSCISAEKLQSFSQVAKIDALAGVVLALDTRHPLENLIGHGPGFGAIRAHTLHILIKHQINLPLHHKFACGHRLAGGNGIINRPLSPFDSTPFLIAKAGKRSEGVVHFPDLSTAHAPRARAHHVINRR